MSASTTRSYTVRYALQDASRGEMHVLAATAFDAIDIALHRFGIGLRMCSARPRPTVQAPVRATEQAAS